MKDDFRKFFDAAKALIQYVDKEDVFDKTTFIGCNGGWDTFQSETFYDLIKNAKKALTEFESAAEKSE